MAANRFLGISIIVLLGSGVHGNDVHKRVKRFGGYGGWNNVGDYSSGCSPGNHYYQDNSDDNTTTIDCTSPQGSGSRCTLWFHDSSTNTKFQATWGDGGCSSTVKYNSDTGLYSYNGVTISDNITCEYTPPTSTTATSTTTTVATSTTTTSTSSTTVSTTTTPNTTPTSQAATSTVPTTNLISASTAPTTPNYGDCCPDNGVWSNWKLVVDCTDSCGSCAQKIYTRTCLSAAWGCPCNGSCMKHENCNIIPCKYPRLSCCSSYRAMGINKQIICGPQPQREPDPPMTHTCIPYDGVWTEWGPWSPCSGAPCGQCGTTSRNRTCGCAHLGCECRGSPTETKSCKVVGIWSPWSSPTQCSDKCGAYGNMTMTRTCTTPDCPCTGISSKTVPCAYKPCDPPREACNCNTEKRYRLMMNNGREVCAPYLTTTPDDLPPEPLPCDDQSQCPTTASPSDTYDM
ncbi:hemicentin-1 [Ditylenchus destructor]|nr:hemicentin-1 [Ditylenchus destructor]